MKLTDKPQPQPQIGQYYLFEGVYRRIVAIIHLYDSDKVSVYWLGYVTDFILNKDTNSIDIIMDNVYDDDVNT